MASKKKDRDSLASLKADIVAHRERYAEAFGYVALATRRDLLVIVTHVAQSGAGRRVRVFLPCPIGDHSGIPREVTHQVARGLALPSNEKGIYLQGGGMDMTLWLSELLSREICLTLVRYTL
jgi:hypothetical protein